MAIEAPDTRYARSGAVYIAYQVYGRGPDLVIVPGLFTHLDMVWEQPTVADFYRRLGRFARVIRFDPRVPDCPTGPPSSPSSTSRSTTCWR